MKEGRIILPVNDNAGASLANVHKSLKKMLCELFGGYTATPGNGGWVNGKGVLVEEPVVVYDVAAVGDVKCTDNLNDLGARIALMAGQDCVYVKGFDGVVALVEPEVFSAVA